MTHSKVTELSRVYVDPSQKMPDLFERQGARMSPEARKARRIERLRKIRLRETTKIPGDIGPGVAPAPVPAAPLVAAPQPSAWWMDPKILLLGAASLFILMRKK